MIPYIRRKNIIELLHQKEIVYLDEMVDTLKVSVATIRRDLKTLEDEGAIELLSGGAARIILAKPEKPLFEKLDLNKEEKNLISGYASTLINDGQFIFIGPGTTESFMIPNLANKAVTVVTNSAYHIESLRKYNVKTIVLGGEVNHNIAVITGQDTCNQISNMFFDKVFIGCSGYGVEGASTSDPGVAECNRIAIKNAKEVYLLADSSKINKNSRYLFTKAEDPYKVITTDKSVIAEKDKHKFIIVKG